jgi:hypothetical protein
VLFFRIIPSVGLDGLCAVVPTGIFAAPVVVSDNINTPFDAGTVIAKVDAVSEPVRLVEPPDAP